MEKITFFFETGQINECTNVYDIEFALSMLRYKACKLIIITDNDGTIYPIELTQMYKAY